MNEKPLVGVVTLLVAVHIAMQVHAWLLATLEQVTQAIP